MSHSFGSPQTTGEVTVRRWEESVRSLQSFASGLQSTRHRWPLSLRLPLAPRHLVHVARSRLRSSVRIRGDCIFLILMDWDGASSLMAIPWGAEVRVEASAAVADTRGMLRSVLLAGRALEFLAGFAAVIWAGGKAVHGPIRRYFERRYRVPIRVETSVTGDCEHGRRIRNRTTVWVTDEFVWTDVAIKLELLPGILHFSIVGAYVVLAVSELCVIDWLLSAPCNLLD